MIRSDQKTGLRCLALGAALLWGSCAPASPPATGVAAPSHAMREKMAQIHEKMAACLRSDRSIADCHQDMMNQCHQALGDQTCRMMQGGGMMKGGGMMGGGRRMTGPPASTPPQP